MANYGRNFAPDQRFYLGPQGGTLEELRGVQGVDPGWDKSETVLNVLGEGYAGRALEGELTHSLSVNRLIVTSTDPAVSWFGTTLAGALTYGPNQSHGQDFIFTSGYLNTYSSSCSIGDVPTADLGLSIYGEMGAGTRGTLATNTVAPSIPLPANISLNVPGYSSNAVQSYDLNLALERRTVPTIGNNFTPSEVLLNLPVEATLSFEMTVNEYEVPDIRTVLCGGTSSTLTIDLNDCNASKIQGFSLPSGEAVAFSLSAGIRENMSVNVTYKSYLNSVADVAAVFS
tara:strand:+ start:728 stop:1585 length:858 start_codon:yes stop_codon:yes gene_type:complete